ncbi:hypothetical protein ACFQT0_15280 [Hymenobacter humi]|uniref:Aspartate/glutamate/uridylate kinase domain-containing protein n=1 Tax=Hymenobacter humi TaxID=1411620 RepID=A0ABW2U6Y6_9BACT
MENVLVYKFGGASVRDVAAIRNLAGIVARYGRQQPLLVVVSAMGKTTNALEELFQLAYSGQDYTAQLAQLSTFHLSVAAELGPTVEQPPADAPQAPTLPELLTQLADQLATVGHGDYDRQYDQIVSFGELLATCIVATAIGAQWLDCRPLIRTDHTWREGRVDWATTERHIAAALPSLLAQGPVLTQGFLGARPAALPPRWAGKAPTTRRRFLPTACEPKA